MERQKPLIDIVNENIENSCASGMIGGFDFVCYGNNNNNNNNNKLVYC